VILVNYSNNYKIKQTIYYKSNQKFVLIYNQSNHIQNIKKSSNIYYKNFISHNHILYYFQIVIYGIIINQQNYLIICNKIK
jgi:hypothetical protein